MSFWNYIGDFFLFRWLCGKIRKSTTEHDAHTGDFRTSIDRESNYLNDKHNGDLAPIDDAVAPIGDSLIDDSDTSEELDDLDIFMRNNNGNNRSSLHHEDYGSDYHDSGRHSFQNDWNSGSFSQSYDDFLDEQDDYDMMDDNF